jgi:archaellum component FlaD/FlaE
MLDKVPRKEIPNLLSFYVKIGWISTGIKAEVVDIIRGMAGEEAEERPKKAKKKAKGGKGKDKDGDVVMTYDKEELHELARSKVSSGTLAKYDTWKMSPEDHLKSLILIERIRGTDLDKDALEDLERDVMNLKEGLEDFFAL